SLDELRAAGAAAVGAEDPPASAWGVGDYYTAETSLRARDGRVIQVEISVRVAEHAGEPVKVIVARDIGERKRGELTLLTLVDNLPDVVVRYDLQLRRIYVNPAFHIVHGTTDEEVLGKLPGEGSRLTEPGAVALQGLLRQTFATRVPCDHEFSLPARDGRIFYWHLRVIPEFDENKAVTSLLTVWSEVTDRKHLLASLDRMAYHDALTGV